MNDSEQLAMLASQSFSAGAKLTVHDVLPLEAELRRNPHELRLRCQLLGYYSKLDSAKSAEEWTKHALWIIDKYANEKLTQFALPWIPSHIIGADFDILRSMWREQIRQSRQCPRVIGHAAIFLKHRDFMMAQRLFRKANDLDPSNPAWAVKLTDLLATRALTLPSKRKRRAALQVFAEAENTLPRLRYDAGVKFDLMCKVCDVALDCGDIDTARSYARKLSRIANSNGAWFGAVYLRLGLIALRQRNIKRAKQYLLKAGEFRFRTDLRLADELLNLGESEIVSLYLRKGFDSMSASSHIRKQLERWILLIQQGQRPLLTISR